MWGHWREIYVRYRSKFFDLDGSLWKMQQRAKENCKTTVRQKCSTVVHIINRKYFTL